MPATSVHFNGSVNLPDAETVMREISARVPVGVRRMTEGETGDRDHWISFQREKFIVMPEFESAPLAQGARSSLLQLREGVSPSQVTWPEIGYASAYVDSFKTFRRLQTTGTLPAGVRFQLQFPTPLAATSMFTPEHQQRLVDHYASALFADLDTALDALPPDQIAVQWDVAVEIGLLAGAFHVEPPDFDLVVQRLARCIDHVPESIPTGLHLCYGDFQHEHFVQPESLQLQVQLANAISAAAHRPVDWIAFTVPQGRDDEVYFAPLRELELGPETELAFALVPYHPASQAEGIIETQARAIERFLGESAAGAREWGVCTECGLGRVDRDDVPKLLDLHSEVLNALHQ